MTNNKLGTKNTTILNNYHETRTVIYTGDGITTIGLSNAYAGNYLLRRFNCGRRNFSGSAPTSHSVPESPNHQEKLGPIVLPQFDITSVIYSFIIHSLLFAILLREKFLIALAIILVYLCFSFFYYFFFQNKERICEFLIQMRRAIVLQPTTFVGIIKKTRLFILA